MDIIEPLNRSALSNTTGLKNSLATFGVPDFRYLIILLLNTRGGVDFTLLFRYLRVMLLVVQQSTWQNDSFTQFIFIIIMICLCLCFSLFNAIQVSTRLSTLYVDKNWIASHFFGLQYWFGTSAYRHHLHDLWQP